MTSLLTEIRQQLDSDYLEYGWLLQIGRELHPDQEPEELRNEVCEATAKLLKSHVAEIGTTYVKDRTLRLKPWGGSIHEKIERMKTVSKEIGTRPQLGEGFWICKSTDI